MIAFLFIIGAWGKVAFPWVQRATLFVIGLAPVVFLLALLQARLARSSVGDLLVGLRAEPSPPSCASARPGAARPVARARLLAAGVRLLGRPHGRVAGCRDPDGRAR